MNIIKDSKLKISSGPYAATIYDNETDSKLIIDWSCDSLYFKYRDDSYITLSIGHGEALTSSPVKIPNSEIHKLNTQESINTFTKLCQVALKELNGYSVISDNALFEIKKMLDLFV